LYSRSELSSAILGFVACTAIPPSLKDGVADFWNREPCGTRYLKDEDEFEAHARSRYELEPHIPAFAGFARSAGLRVLEIGVGMGADYEQWLKAGAHATGIDLSSVSLGRARRRCELAGWKPDLHLADGENLPFPDRSFDLVYSYGVMHHSPDTARCLQEAWRVLKPGGGARIMLYGHPSITGFMLWLRYGVWRFRCMRRCVYERLESPGTTSFTEPEIHTMMAGFDDVRIERVLSPGDLLLHKPSSKFQGAAYKIIWKTFPRGLIRRCGKRWGLFLLITAKKPA